MLEVDSRFAHAESYRGPAAAPGRHGGLDVKCIYLLIICQMRRKPGTLIPLEETICRCAAAMRRARHRRFHGYELARRIGTAANRRLLTGYGTLYRALARLEAMGLLRSRREDPDAADRENRPRRRLYTLTALYEPAAAEATAEATAALPTTATRRRRPVPA